MTRDRSFLLSRFILGALFSGLSLLSVQCSLFEEKGGSIAFEEVNVENVKTPEETNSASLARLHIPLTKEQRESMALETVVPTKRTLQQERTVYGKILPNEQRYAHVVTQLSGIVREVYKQRADVVHAGEPLALLDSPELSEAVTGYMAALHQRDVAESILQREERLYRQQLVAENTLIEARNKLKQQRMEVVFAEQKLGGLGLSQSQVEKVPHSDPASWRQIALNAPLDGVVLERDLVVGEWVNAQHPAFTVVDLNTVWAELEVPVLELESISLGKSLKLYDLLSRDQTKGRIIYISPTLNQENLTVHVVVELDNKAKKWRLGSAVEAQLLVGSKEVALTVPRTAIQRIEGQEIVFVESEEGFTVRPVDVGVCDTHCVEILGGLCEEDKCVVGQTFILKSQLVLREEENEHGPEEKSADGKKEATQ